MALYRPDIPQHVAAAIRGLPPDIKRGVRAALRALSADPRHGEPLRGELKGLWKFRVRRYRIVYAIDGAGRTLRIYAVGHRRGIYDQTAGLLRRSRSGE